MIWRMEAETLCHHSHGSMKEFTPRTHESSALTRPRRQEGQVQGRLQDRLGGGAPPPPSLPQKHRRRLLILLLQEAVHGAADSRAPTSPCSSAGGRRGRGERGGSGGAGRQRRGRPSRRRFQQEPGREIPAGTACPEARGGSGARACALRGGRCGRHEARAGPVLRSESCLLVETGGK